MRVPAGRKVAVLAAGPVSMFELGVACEAFGTDRSDTGIPSWDFAVCALRPGPVPTRAGFSLRVSPGLDRVEAADLVIVPSWAERATPVPERLGRALRRAADRGAWLLGFCSGPFALAHAGLLDGQRATAHWLYAEEFRTLFPSVLLDPNVLYVADGPVMTSAGTASAIDLALHVVRSVDGPEVANSLARRMVVPPHRDGGQAQFVERPVPADPGDHQLTDLLGWAGRHLDQDLTVDRLAARLYLAPRTFARRFREATGTTPYHWVTGQRVLYAQRLLETTRLDIDQIAERCGFGGAATLRHHFLGQLGTTPQRYRQQFCHAAPVGRGG